MTRVLVTAATQPLGAALLRSLSADPEVELVLAVAADPPPADLARLPRVEWERADLGRARHLRQLLFGRARALAIDAVVHTALHARAGDRGPRIHEENVGSTRELLHLAERQGTIRRIVYRSFSAVYHVDDATPTVIDEEQALELEPAAPQWVRDRVEADVTVCMRMGLTRPAITVLRCAEVFAPDSDGQLFDYVGSRVCFRPLGYDPMIMLLSVADAERAVRLALRAGKAGIFNVPGKDALPLSRVIARCGRLDAPVPGPLLGGLYALRRLTTGRPFRYDMNVGRFHFGGVLDGTRARAELGYVPEVAIDWPS